ncbi:MAG: ATP synthase F1 subunit delta [Melioribacteraceae bacterium]|jgi:F-type H+-transporting ATPase subunit delta|nr:ATP synthase F1 subunit delta [Melioribacteraceae bacterium]
MSNFNISTRYANALIEFAQEKDSLEQVSDDMILVENVLSDSKELRTVLKSPVINNAKKKSILQEIFVDKTSKVSIEFILFVNIINRESILFDIAKRYNALRNIKLKRVETEINSTVDFSDEQKKYLQKQLAEFSQMEIIPTYKTDESLIGGFTVKMNDTVIDASVKQQLKKLRKSLVSN